MSRIVIRPPGAFNVPPLRELWDAREVMYRFGARDLVLRYRQTVIGVAWVLLQPLASAGIFSIVFGQVAKLPSGGVPYFLFSYVGLLAWNVFNGIVSRAAPSLVANQALVSKVFFPRIMVPFSSVISVLIDFAVGLGLLVVLLIVYGVAPGWPIVFTPVWLLFAVLLATGLGTAASAVMVKYRDITYLLPWILQILLYATPIAYSLSAVPADLRWLFNLNPLTWLMQFVRWSTIGGQLPEVWQLVALPVVSAAVFVAGVLVFQRNERAFADFI